MKSLKVFAITGMTLSTLCVAAIVLAETQPAAVAAPAKADAPKPAVAAPAAPAAAAAPAVAAAPAASAPAEAVSTAPEGVIANGRKVKFDYSLSVDGKEVESSKGGEPIEFVQGKSELVPGLEKALQGMKVGDEKTVKVSVEEGYGPVDPQAIQEVPRNLIPADIELKVGSLLEMSDDQGNKFPATVMEIKEDKVKLDFNHPLAGKELTFNVKIVSVK